MGVTAIHFLFLPYVTPGQVQQIDTSNMQYNENVGFCDVLVS